MRLDWQPLWWDEGYSVYFATESLTRMVLLTARDIHPPLYYALLHGWLDLWGNAGPIALRSMSVLIGVATVPALWWAANGFFPGRRRVSFLAVGLLVVSPMHVFYSQEVRMYGLEMLLGLLSTGFFWRMMHPSSRADFRRAWLGYVLTTLFALYTEYYVAFLPGAHLLWALYTWRKQPAKWRPVLTADALIALAYLPWILYAAPKLIPYIDQKIVADNDRPLNLLSYLGRHVLAFSAGHVPAMSPALDWLRYVGVGSVLLLVGLGGARWFLHRTKRKATDTALGVSDSGNRPFRLPSATSALLAFLLVPVVIGFGLNLRLPFFPEGGERVLLFVMPYFLLLVAWGVDRTFDAAGLGTAAVLLGMLLLGAGAGLFAFYTVARYSENDYRPLIRQVTQQGADEDTVFTVFPWQVGYWRAYAPVFGRGEQHGPWPVLSPSPAWNEQVASTLDEALRQGRVWFPEHLALGAILETQAENYLAERAINFEDRWYTTTTRLSAWSQGQSSTPRSLGADFGPVQLASVGVAPQEVASANQVLDINFVWQVNPSLDDPLGVTLRLQDGNGTVWANRDYQPLGLWGDPSPDGQIQEDVGLLVPPGLPPGPYAVVAGVGYVDEESLLPARTPAGDEEELVTLANVQVVEPEQPVSPIRLPIQWPLAEPEERDGFAFLGYAGYVPDAPPWSGETIRIVLFVQNRNSSPVHRELYVSLLDKDGAGVAGWEGWPLPGYFTEQWRPGALVQLPVEIYLPAGLSAGEYTLVAGFQDASGSGRSKPAVLGRLSTRRRAATYERPQPTTQLDPPPQFGTHARLIGYDLHDGDGDYVDLVLYWEVLQTLLPPHHVFVHLDGPAGNTLTQDDAVPGGHGDTPAPTGSWLPGEFITDAHRLPLPATMPDGVKIRVGLYDPETGVRLPVFVEGAAKGDAVEIPLLP